MLATDESLLHWLPTGTTSTSLRPFVDIRTTPFSTMHRSHLKVGRYFEKSLLAETDPMAPIPTNAGAVMTGGSSTHLVVIGTVRNVDGHEPTLGSARCSVGGWHAASCMSSSRLRMNSTSSLKSTRGSFTRSSFDASRKRCSLLSNENSIVFPG